MLANVTADWLPNLTGKNVKRIQKRVKEDNPEKEVIFLHCIIQQKKHCVNSYGSVVKPVEKLNNFIRVRELQHCHFIKFLEETDADHQDLLCHSNVRWGKYVNECGSSNRWLSHFLELLERGGNFPELSDTDWLCDLAFAVDIRDTQEWAECEATRERPVSASKPS